MRDPQTILQDLVGAGLTGEQLALVIELTASVAMEGRADGPTKTARQKRNARYYEGHKDNRLKPSETVSKATEASNSDAPFLEAKGFPTPLPKTQSIRPPSPPKGAHGSTDYPPNAFDVWYDGYPNKVGKGAAVEAFDKVRRGRKATFAELIAGRDRYIRTKPPDRSWCNPATWLNQQRWLDEPESPSTLRLVHGQPPQHPDPNRSNRRQSSADSDFTSLARAAGLGGGVGGFGSDDSG
jgi:hypothetical protein